MAAITIPGPPFAHDGPSLLFPEQEAALPAGVTGAARRMGWDAKQFEDKRKESVLIDQCPETFDMVVAGWFDMEGSTSITINKTQWLGRCAAGAETACDH